MSEENQASEEILLYSRDTQTKAQVSLNTVTHQLSQYNRWKMQRKLFKVYDDKILSVVDMSLTSTKKYWVQLCHFDPEPVNVRSINFRIGLAALVLSLIAYLTVSAGTSFELATLNQHYKSIAALLITLSVICLVFMIYTSKNLTVFFTYHARYPIAMFLKNYPSKSEYNTFVSTLSELVKRARETSIHEKSQDLANELSELRRLKNASIVTENEYDEAKRKIFSHHGSGPDSEPQSTRLNNIVDSR